jgi:hypothetical protein
LSRAWNSLDSKL